MTYDSKKHKERIGIDVTPWISVDVDTDGEVQFAEARDKFGRLVETTEAQRIAMVEEAKEAIAKRS